MDKKNSEMTKNVLFVCTANQCRSPMAMVLFKDLIARSEEKENNWQIGSAGVRGVSGLPATREAILVMSEMGLDLLNHRSRPITESLINEFNLILCMKKDHVDSIKQDFPTAKNKVYLLSEMADQDQDINDPVNLPMDAYRHTVSEILDFLKKGFSKIVKLS